MSAAMVHRGLGGRVVVVASAVACFAASMLGGCAGRGDQRADTIRALTDRNAALLQENEAKDQSIRSLQDRMEAANQLAQRQQSLATDLEARNARLERQLAELDSTIRELSFGPLDSATDAQLEALARSHPDILAYDPERGMIRFVSDLTFGSGSDELKPEVKSMLADFARILNSTTAAGYDLRIVGHTDSQRISAGTAQRHPTNLHLSAHRAISVFNELKTAGMDAARMEIAGRGEFWPMVANTATGNTPQNRRVEIYVVRSQGRPAGAPADSTTPPPEGVTPRATDEDIMK